MNQNKTTASIDSQNQICFCLVPCLLYTQCLNVLCLKGKGVYLTLYLDENTRIFAGNVGVVNRTFLEILSQIQV